MKISELLEELGVAQGEHGDIEVRNVSFGGVLFDVKKVHVVEKPDGSKLALVVPQPL